MIEAMACGTPVLAFRCGSVPEIVEDGVTGAIVETVDEAIAALPRVIALDRQKVRRRFEQRFSATRMAKDYVGVYRSLIASSPFIGGKDDDRLRLPNGGDANVQRLSIA
jgi:glycosyltransferase involved in cell wall biosynthesis